MDNSVRPPLAYTGQQRQPDLRYEAKTSAVENRVASFLQSQGVPFATVRICS